VAYALVGSVGALATSSSGGAITPAWGTGENRTAGNLLVAWWAADYAYVQAVPSGWTLAVGSSSLAAIYYRVATGGDAAPTFGALSSTTQYVQLAEFSGGVTSNVLDQTGYSSVAGSPTTATLSAADRATGELLVAATMDYRSASVTNTDSLTSNNGTFTYTQRTSGTTNLFVTFGYAVTTANASADTVVRTSTNTTNFSSAGLVGASFGLFVPVYDPLTTMHGTW
jgi:hypothetical protein